MFNNNKNDYLNAIKHAQVYTSTETKSSNKKLLIFNFIFLALVSYVAFTYVQSNNTLSLPVSKQAVLGVSETVDDSEVNDVRLMKILTNEPSIQSKSSYTEAIARELDDKSGFRGRIAVVNQEDEVSKN